MEERDLSDVIREYEETNEIHTCNNCGRKFEMSDAWWMSEKGCCSRRCWYDLLGE